MVFLIHTVYTVLKNTVYVTTYVLTSNLSGIYWCDLQELKLLVKKCTLTFFVALGMRSEGNATKNGEPTVGFSIATVLQHSGRFWSMISCQRTPRQHWNNTNAPLTWMHLVFTCSFAWNQHWRDCVFVILRITLGMWWKNWKVFNKVISWNVSNTFIVADRTM